MNRVNAEISRQTRAQVRAGAVGAREAVKEEMNAILAELRHDLIYADLQNAFANLYASVGLDAYAPGLRGDEPVDELARALRDFWKARGDRAYSSTHSPVKTGQAPANRTTADAVASPKVRAADARRVAQSLRASGKTNECRGAAGVTAPCIAASREARAVLWASTDGSSCRRSGARCDLR